LTKSKTIPIIYEPGAYGSYLYWVLNNFTSIGLCDSPELPWGKNGNSHTQKNFTIYNSRINMPTFEQHVHGPDTLPFFRMHHVFNDERDLTDSSAGESVDYILSKVVKGILIRSDADMHLLIRNNKHDKVHDRYLIDQHRKEINDEDFSKVANMREFYSYKEFIKGVNSVGEYNSKDKCIEINIKDLLFDFKNTLMRLARELNFDVTESYDTIMTNHNEMLSLQKHLNKDKDIALFLDNFTKHINCNMPDDSTVYDEAYIQKYLREELNLELRCNDIGDDFPKTTTELWTYTYPKELHE